METAGTVSRPGDEIRSHVHGMWSAVAPAWGDHAAYVDERSAQLTEELLGLAHVRPGQRVLELACGPGGLGLTVAPRVQPGGTVVLSDVAPEMTAIAAGRAAAQGLGNVSTRVLDLERIDEPEGSFDAVLCREGLMFALDHARAASEIRRVLRPGGRAAVAVWDARERNPWLGLVLDAVSAQLGAPVPPPGVPGPFSLGDAGRLAGILRCAGLADVTVRPLPVPVRAGSFEEWWQRTTVMAGPLAKVLRSQPASAVEAIRERLREATRAYATPEGIEIPGIALLGSATK